MTKAFRVMKAAAENIILNEHHTRTAHPETNSGSHQCELWCWATQWSDSTVDPVLMDR